MHYYQKSNEIINKYEVIFDQNEILSIKKEIKDNCTLMHLNEVNTAYPDNFKNGNTKIISKRKLGMKYSKQTNHDLPLYVVKYFSFDYPLLIYLINDFLSGNASVLDQIFDYRDEREMPSNILARIVFEYDEIPFENIEKKRKKLDELEQAIEFAKLNENQKPVYEYIEKIRNVVKLRLVDSIEYEDVKKYSEFFGTEEPQINLKKHV